MTKAILFVTDLDKTLVVTTSDDKLQLILDISLKKQGYVKNTSKTKRNNK